MESLPFGPWKTVSSGEWGGHSFALYQNPERVLLLLVHDKAFKGGASVLMKRVFSVEGSSGDLLSFLNSQKRVMTIIEKISKYSRNGFLILEAEPSYVKDVEKELAGVIKKDFTFLSGVANALVGVSSSYGARVVDLKDAPEAVADILTGDPLTLFAMAKDGGSRQLAQAKETVFGLVGVSSSGEQVNASASDLAKALVVGASGRARGKALQVLCENALLNNVSTVILSEDGGGLSGLAEANEGDANAIEALGGKPHGFPVQLLDAQSGLSASLADLTSQEFAAALEVGGEVGKALELAAAGARDLLALKQNLRLLSHRDARKDCVDAALRVAELLARDAGDLFEENEGGRAAFEESACSGHVARAFIVQARQPWLKRLLALSLASGLSRKCVGGLKAVLVLEADAVEFPQSVLEALARRCTDSFGVIACASHAIDATGLGKPKVLLEIAGWSASGAERAGGQPGGTGAEATPSVGGTAAKEGFFLTEKGAKTRFTLRPTFSKPVA